MIRRRIVLTYWVLAVSLFIPSISNAYIDPATTTYIIQIITALVITLGVTMSIAFYKLKMLALNIRILFFGIRNKFFSKKQRDEAKAERDAKKKNPEMNSEGLRYGIPKPRSEYEGVVPLPEPEPEPEKPPRRKGFIGLVLLVTNFLFHDDRKFYKRWGVAALVAAVLPFTIIIFGILDLVISNQDVVIFSYKDILERTLQVALYYYMLILIPLLIFRGKVFDFVVSIILALSIGAYLQGTFLNIDLGQLTGDAIPWDKYIVHGIINTIIWLCIMGGVFVLRYFSKKNWTRVCIFVPSIILVVQLVALISIIPSDTPKIEHPHAPPHIIDRLADDVGIVHETPEERKEREEIEGKIDPKDEPKPTPPHEIIEAKYGKLAPGEEYSLTLDGINDVSSENNIIFIILDRLDVSYIQSVLEDHPTFFDGMDGFTSYTNNISHYSRTFPSVASTLTEKIHLFDIPATEYLSKAYPDSRFLPDLQDLGFSTRLYMERPYTYTDIEQLFGMADNIGGIKFTVKVERSVRSLTQLSMFRYTPHFLKKPFFLSPHEFGKTRKAKSASGAEPYITDDVKFYERLINDGLKITTDKGNFVFYHLQGPHTPFTMTEDIQRVKTDESDYVRQTMGSFNVTFEFMNQLKELGLYEDATIIITGDHGISWNRTPLGHPILTGLFYKPSGSAGTPLAYNNAPVNPDNLRATIIDAAGGDASSYGKTYTEVAENDTETVRKYYYRLNERPGYGPLLEEFEVRGDANDFANWNKIQDIVIKYWFG